MPSLPALRSSGSAHRPWRRLCVAIVASTMLVLSACSAQSVAGSGNNGAATPALSSVTPLTDPHSFVGPSSAIAGTTAVQPITAGTQTLPATITDSQGTTVTITDSSRILALDIYGSLSRIVFELGLGENVIGRDLSSDFPEIHDRQLVTQNGHDLNAEAILNLAPTVIITDTSLGPWDTILQMRDAGIPVVVVDSHRAIDKVGPLVQQVADALGVSQRGTELAQRAEKAIDSKVAEIAAVAPKAPEDKLRVVFLYVRGQSGVYYLFGKESGADSLITSLGARDVAGEQGWQGMRPVTDEALINANPDLILVMTKGLESVGGVSGLLESIPAVAQTSAGKNQRIVDMADSTILSFGPESAAVLDALAVAIYAPADAKTGKQK